VELVAKAFDAASMFWASLDSRERATIGYMAAWMLFALIAGARRRERERIKQELRDELEHGRA
jgi:hypothetical protein